MRQGSAERATRETNITVSINLDGKGRSDISTGIAFMDHMLTLFAKHGKFDLTIAAKGDLEVDCHHTMEDLGLVLGEALAQAFGDKKGIRRYGNFLLPMDESLAFVSLDISGRPYLVFNAEFPEEKVGEFDSCMCEEFMRAFAYNAGITLHVNMIYGGNTHHQIEAIFKALAHALAIAVKENGKEVLSTKGSL